MKKAELTSCGNLVGHPSPVGDLYNVPGVQVFVRHVPDHGYMIRMGLWTRVVFGEFGDEQ